PGLSAALGQRCFVSSEGTLQSEDTDQHLEAPRRMGEACSPTAFGELLVDLVHADAGHRGTETAADLGEDVRVAEVGGGLDDGLCSWRGVVALEDARADE